jgi:undecaprenyl-diphosphatase
MEGNPVTIFEAIILGILQGLTEFLPISSSAHLRIAGEFLPGASDPGATFTAITQIGTEIAVLIYFWRDIRHILGAWFRHLWRPKTTLAAMDPEARQAVRMGWLIIVGTIPIVIVGYTAQSAIRDVFRSLWLVATVLIVFGLILWAADYFGRRTRTLEHLTTGHGIAYGLAQTLALVPGVSRSGATISMGRALGYTRVDATRYAFLLAIPAVFGSGFYELRTALFDPLAAGPIDLLATFVATLTAGVVGFVVIAWLMRYLTTHSFLPFVIYRVALGTGLLILLGTGVIEG